MLTIPIQKRGRSVATSGPLPIGWRKVYAGEENGTWTTSEQENINKWTTLALQPASIFIAGELLERTEDEEMIGVSTKTRRIIERGREDIQEVMEFLSRLTVNDKIGNVINKWFRNGKKP